LRKGKNSFFKENFLLILRERLKIPSKGKTVQIGAMLGKMKGVHFLGLYEREKKRIAGFHFLGPGDIKT